MTSEERLLRLENAFATLVELSRNMDERMDESNARQSALENNLTALSQIVIELAQSQHELTQSQHELAQSQRRTDERLDRLAALFERHISDHVGES